MKAQVVLLIIVGIVNVIANPTSPPENPSNDKETPVTEVSQSEVKYEEQPSIDNVELNKVVITEDFLPKPDGPENNPANDNVGEVDIVIEETPLDNVISDEQNGVKIDDDDYLSPGDQFIDTILADRMKDEIMETAAGFAPIPLLFRKKHRQPARRRFAIRRHFQRYPYAPYRTVPFYYPYYRFYRPSSLRFY